MKQRRGWLWGTFLILCFLAGGLFAAGASAQTTPGPGAAGAIEDAGEVVSYEGLIWEKKRNLDNVQVLGDPHDADNLYSWSNSGVAPDGAAFTDFLKRVNTPPCPAGRCDWRLPTIEELQGLIRQPCPPDGGGLCIDPVLGPTANWVYWSSTTVSPLPGNAWSVYFDDGSVGDYFSKSFPFHVRAVSGCTGDGDVDMEVSVDEIVGCIEAALMREGSGAFANCDRDGNEEVSVDELVIAVVNAVRGCEGGVAPSRVAP